MTCDEMNGHRQCDSWRVFRFLGFFRHHSSAFCHCFFLLRLFEILGDSRRIFPTFLFLFLFVSEIRIVKVPTNKSDKMFSWFINFKKIKPRKRRFKFETFLNFFFYVWVSFLFRIDSAFHWFHQDAWDSLEILWIAIQYHYSASLIWYNEI